MLNVFDLLQNMGAACPLPCETSIRQGNDVEAIVLVWTISAEAARNGGVPALDPIVYARHISLVEYHQLKQIFFDVEQQLTAFFKEATNVQSNPVF